MFKPKLWAMSRESKTHLPTNSLPRRFTFIAHVKTYHICIKYVMIFKELFVKFQLANFKNKNSFCHIIIRVSFDRLGIHSDYLFIGYVYILVSCDWLEIHSGKIFIGYVYILLSFDWLCIHSSKF